MSAQYGYPSSGAYHQGANATHAPAEGYAADGDYPHEAYTSVASDQYDNSSDSYVTAGAEPYGTANAGVQYGYAGQPGQPGHPGQPGQSPVQAGQPVPPGIPSQPVQFSFENPVWRFWVSSEGISRKVIQDNISAFLGHDAKVKTGPGIGDDAGKPGYWISAYRDLTATMKDDLKKFTIQAERGVQAQPTQRYSERALGRRGVTPPQPTQAGYQAPQSRRGHDPRQQDPYANRQPNPPYTQAGYQPGPDQQYYAQYGHPPPAGEPYQQYQQQHHGQRPPVPPAGNFGVHQPPPQSQYAYQNQAVSRPQYAGEYAQQPTSQPQEVYNYNQNTTPPPTSANIPAGYYMGTDGRLWPYNR